MSDLSSFLSTRNDKWSDKLWDGLIEAIGARLAPLEENLGIQREVADAIIARGLTVIEQELAPIVAQAGDILDETSAEVVAKLVRFEAKVTGGTVLTTSATPATLVSDATINVVIDAPDREFFALTPHVALSRSSTTANWAIGKVLYYARSTGALSLKIEQVYGAGGPYSDWIISSLPAATLLQKTFYEQTVVLRGQVAADKSDAELARDVAVGARDAAIISAAAAGQAYSDLRVAVAPPVAAPSSPVLGQIWYDGTTMRVFDGDDYVPVAPWNALSAVSYEAQLLSDIQMAQARANIGAVGNLLGPPKFFINSGDYTAGPEVSGILVEILGGGGSGAGAVSTGTSARIGGGGAAGGYSFKFFNLAELSDRYFGFSIGAPALGQIGAGTTGGTTTFTHPGDAISFQATGGIGGQTNSGVADQLCTSSAPGGGATGGDYNRVGASGEPGLKLNISSRVSGKGGDSKYGVGGRNVSTNGITVSAPGLDGSGFGSGGSGGVSSSTVDAAGGNGKQGLVAIWELG